jgi:hypothetical protein
MEILQINLGLGFELWIGFLHRPTAEFFVINLLATLEIDVPVTVIK